MASFTDQILQFNPYVQQLPTQAMAQVGMYKQQKYEEGVQKVQSYIDNIAGLDVVRDVDKAYLQSKLNELGGKLKSVAAGDFSNFQLVNSIGGMSTQIIKDPNVQNAVQSTSWYRKQLAEMEKAISEGKSSVENIYDFNDKASKWLSSTELKQKFSDRYTPYIDIKKKAMDAIKVLHPKLQQYDIPFEIKDGKINTAKIADAMKRYKVEGISEADIKNALFATMTPDDLNQMAISAKYQFRDVTPEDLARRADTNYKFQRRTAEEELKFLNQQRGVVSDPTQIEKIDERIKYNKLLLGENGVPGILDEQLKENLEFARTNPDAVKTALYKDGFVKEFANAFSWKNQIESYETNPIRAQLNWVEDMKFKQQVERRNAMESDRDYNLAVQRLQIDAETLTLKKLEMYGDPNASDWTPLGNATDNQLRATELFTNHVSSVAGAVEGDLAKLRTKYTDGQINEMLTDWEKNGTKGTKIKADAIKLLENISKNKNYLQSLKDKESQLMAQATNEVSKDPKRLAKLQEAQSVLSNLDKGVIEFARIKLGDTGKTVNVTPSQIVKDIQSGIAKLSVDKAVAGDIRLTYNVDGKSTTVTLSKKVLPFGADVTGGKQMRPVLLAVNDYLNKYGGIQKEYNKAVDERYKQKLAPLAQQFVPQIKAVTTGKNGEPPPIILSRLSQLITAADINKIAADANFDVTKASTLLLEENKKDTRVFIEQDGDNFKVHLKSEKDPLNRQTLKLSRNDVINYFGPGYVNDKTQESIRIKIGGGNTNITGDPNQAVMQKQFGDFPGIRKFQVTADLNQDLSNSDLYTAMINVKRKDGTYATFEISGNNKMQRVGYDQGRQSLNSLTDATLLKLLKEEYPNYDFSNLDY